MGENWMERLGLPDEGLPGVPLVEIAGENRVLMEHHCGVTEYSPCRIGVRVKFGRVIIIGEGLSLSRMTRGQLIVSGKICCVQLERRGR